MLKFCQVWARMKINENPFPMKKTLKTFFADKENKFQKFQLYLYVM